MSSQSKPDQKNVGPDQPNTQLNQPNTDSNQPNTQPGAPNPGSRMKVLPVSVFGDGTFEIPTSGFSRPMEQTAPIRNVGAGEPMRKVTAEELDKIVKASKFRKDRDGEQSVGGAPVFGPERPPTTGGRGAAEKKE